MVDAFRQRVPVQSLTRLLFVVAASLGIAAAQTEPPTIQSVSPPGVMPGSYFDLVIEGRNLGGASSILFLGSGVNGTIDSVLELSRGLKPSSKPGASNAAIEDPSTENRVLAKVLVDPGTPPGHRLFRLLTPLGTSNIAGFDINNLPLDFEAEPNNTLAQAQEIHFPVTVNAAINAPDDVDLYKFQAKAGQQVSFLVTARRINSSLDAVLRLLDWEGRRLAHYEDLSAPDAQLTYKIPSDGEYFLEVRDLNNGGGKRFFYRLNACLGPPASDDADAQAALAKLQAEYGKYPETAVAPGGALPLPATVKGVVAGESGDLYHFSARKGQKLVLDVMARRFGSPLDSCLEILDSNHKPLLAATARALQETQLERGIGAANASTVVLTNSFFHVGDSVWIGHELLKVTVIPESQNPTLIFESEGGRRVGHYNTTPMQYGPNQNVYKVDVFPAGAEVKSRGLPLFPIYYANDDGGAGYGKDSRIDFTAPAAGEYFVRIRDVRGEHGPDFAYRLAIHEPAPDFHLTFTPANPNVPRGGRVPVTVSAQRIDGFDGAIDVSIPKLPRGLRALNGRIAPGQYSTTLVLEADASADTPPSRFEVVGVSGRRTRNAEPREAVGSAILAGADLAPLSLVSLATPADITVTAEPQVLALKPGQQITATLHVRRAPGFKARVPLTIANLPPGVSVKDIGLNGILINEDETSRTIELEADPSARPIEQPFYAVGIVETNSPIPQRQASLPVTIRVLPPSAPDSASGAVASFKPGRVAR
ncbi:MAG TPA: PPC domain-containing protein [Bryobacterales bacterium]|nr:PPC domain-containing protein [Bryobacterales bacterium]